MKHFFCIAVLVVAGVFSSASAATLVPQRVVDVDGQVHSLLDKKSRATAIIFLGTECPISNRYIPSLNDMAKSAGAEHVDFVAVISDSTLTRNDVKAYQEKYKIAFPVIFDASGVLAKTLAPTHTPEAFLLDANGEIQYQGRIDDTFAALGKINQVVKSHDLTDAIASLLAGRPIANAKTDSIGCPFESNLSKNQPAKIVYTRDIAPILNANCVSCHRTGEIAPFALTSYSDAAKRAKMLSDVTGTRYMPPWKPVAGYGNFLGEHRLSDSEIALIKSWADSGAAEGNAADLPPSPSFASGWKLGTPDMVLKMPEPYTIPASGPDIYRAFVVPMNIPDDCYVAGIEFKPEAKSVLHHCILYLDVNGAARQLDERDPGPGYTSFGGPGFRPTGTLGGWAPGATPSLLPDGIGRYVRKGSDVVFQMHYHPDGREHTDQSSVAIYLQKKPIQKRLVSIALMTIDIGIPPGESNYTRNVNVTLPADMTLMGIVPHMHLLGRDMKVEAITPDNKTIPLIWINDWDFKWQGQYQFAKPTTLTKGTTIQMSARYDNSTSNPDNPSNPPKRVSYGEQTTDEMCICFLEYLADSPEQTRTIRTELTRQMIAQAIRQRLTGSNQ